MRTRTIFRATMFVERAVVILATLLAVAALAGCQSPMETAYVTRGTFNQTVTDLTAARQANVIDAKTFAADVAVADTIPPQLDLLDAAAVGGSLDFWGIYESVKPKLHDLVTKAILAKKGKP